VAVNGISGAHDMKFMKAAFCEFSSLITKGLPLTIFSLTFLIKSKQGLAKRSYEHLKKKLIYE